MALKVKTMQIKIQSSSSPPSRNPLFRRSSVNNTTGPIELNYFPYLKNRGSIMMNEDSTERIPETHGAEIMTNRVKMAVDRLEHTEK